MDVFKSIPVLVFLLFCILSDATAEGQGEDGWQGRQQAVMGSSSLGSSWYPTAARISSVCMKYSDTVIAVQASGGGSDNIYLMKGKKIDMGIVESNVMTYSYQGTGRFKGNPYPGMRFVTTLYPIVYQPVVHKNSGINSIYALKGKTFSPVTEDFSEDGAWQEILETAFNFRKSDIIWKPVPGEQRGAAFRDMVIDALGFESSSPSGSVLETAAQSAISLLPIGGTERNKLQQKFWWYKPWTIVSGTYPGQAENVETVAIDCVIVADRGVNDKIVYDLVRTLYGKDLDMIRSVHQMSSYIMLENALSGAGPVPLHPGAEKYYREKGLIR